MKVPTMKSISDVVCSFCGCLCDDIEVVIDNNRIAKAKKACALGKARLLTAEDPERLRKPLVREQGELVDASLDRAIKNSAGILSNAKLPLLYGWSTTSCEAQRIGLEIAEEIGGIFDNTTSVCHGPTTLAYHEVGMSACTLGEVKNRADVIIYWGSNPLEAHPRHISRYTYLSKGLFRKSPKERELIVVDARETKSARLATRFLKVKPNSDYELLSALRIAVKTGDLDRETVAGITKEEIIEIAELMKNAEYGALFFGLGLTMSRGKHRNIDAAICLTSDLNAYTKWVIMPMRGHYNVTGANAVSAWIAGFPFGVDFSRGYPRYNPGETTAVELLLREEVDAALIVASDPVSNFPIKAAEHLARIPMIAIDPHRTPTTEIADVVIPSAIVGIEVEGTAYRMDHVPLRLKKMVEPPAGCLADEEILERLLKAIKKP